jgi:hypothetical protein
MWSAPLPIDAETSEKILGRKTPLNRSPFMKGPSPEITP